jgi:hypothetical protein
MKERFNIKRNFDGTYSVCDNNYHSLKSFRDYNQALNYFQCLMSTPYYEPVVKSEAEIKREERRAKLKKLFNFD